MKSKLGLWIPAAMLFTTACALAQGTTFTYQGRLQDGTNHATGIYDLTFGVWTTAAGPAQIGSSVTNLAIGVTNGLFAVSLDFGGGVFDGSPRWLEIGVRTNGGGGFALLSPRQSLNATPYAIHAGGVNAAGINGIIPATSIGDGTITSNLLAPGAAAANLFITAQSAVPTGGMILSSNANDANLVNSDFVKLGSVELGEIWEKRSSASWLRARRLHSAVWTGSEMIVWGGYDGTNFLNDGARYNPANDTWMAMTMNGAPTNRCLHTAIWTGSEMIVWGGSDGSTRRNDGARYSPTGDSWLAMTTNCAPAKRSSHTAVWTGSGMIVWGGQTGTTEYANDGACYSPTSDTWLTIATNGTPAGRSLHSAVWTGSEMIVWGGYTYLNGNLDDGASYDPEGDAWSPVGRVGNSPSARNGHTAVWTGREMIVWGGRGFDPTLAGAAACYDPTSLKWRPAAAACVQQQRSWHTAVWTGIEMIVLGGFNGSTYLDDGARFNPSNNTWMSAKTNTASARMGHTAVWTGSEMIVWGWDGTNRFNDTFTYNLPRGVYLYQRR